MSNFNIFGDTIKLDRITQYDYHEHSYFVKKTKNAYFLFDSLSQKNINGQIIIKMKNSKEKVYLIKIY